MGFAFLETSKSTYFPPLLEPSNPLVAPQCHCVKTKLPTVARRPSGVRVPHHSPFSVSPESLSSRNTGLPLTYPNQLGPASGLYMCCALRLENPLSDLCPLTFWVSKYLDNA